MKTKKVPMRSCIITKEKCAKQDLIRIVRTPDGQVIVDLTGKQNGKGAYLKKDISVFEKAKKSKALDRVLDIIVPEEIYDKLYKLLD